MKKLLFFLFILALTGTNFSCKKNPENTPVIPNDTIPYDSSLLDTTGYEPVIKTGVYFHLSPLSLDSIKNMLKGKWLIKSGAWFTDSRVELFTNNAIDSIKWYNDTAFIKNGAAYWFRIATGVGTDSSVHIRLPATIRYWSLEYGNTDSLYVYDGELYYFLIKER